MRRINSAQKNIKTTLCKPLLIILIINLQHYYKIISTQKIYFKMHQMIKMHQRLVSNELQEMRKVVSH